MKIRDLTRACYDRVGIFYRPRISIALNILSLDPIRSVEGFSIALPIRSVDRQGSGTCQVGKYNANSG